MNVKYSFKTYKMRAVIILYTTGKYLQYFLLWYRNWKDRLLQFKNPWLILQPHVIFILVLVWTH